MWPFRRKQDGVFDDLGNFYEIEESDPVKIYVNLLLLDLCRDEPNELVLKQSRPLPILVHFRETECEIPEFRKVANRLKVMAQLDPVVYPEPRDGQIEMIVKENRVTVFLRCEDKCDDPTIRLRAEITSKQS